MLPSLVRKTLRDDRRAVLGWTAGIGVFIMLYVSFWAELRDDPAGADSAAANVPAGLRDSLGWQDLSSATGYLEATVYSLFVPVLLIICAVTLGARAIAAPEGTGLLDLLLVNPISRRRFVVQRFLAIAVGLLVIGAVAWALVLLLASVLDMDIAVVNITAASLGLLLLGLTFAALAVAVSSVVGRRGVVLATTGAAAVGCYLIYTIGTQVEWVRPLRWVSPFHYYLGGDPLRDGFAPGYLLVLVALVVGLVAAAAVRFERRDVGV